MAVVDPRNHLPDADPQRPLHGPLSEPLDDPLGEFASEPPPRRERRIEFASEPPPRREPLLEFTWEPPPPSEPLIEFAPEWRGPIASSRTPKGRWFIGVAMLAVGLLAGFAGGVALVTRYGGEQDASVRSLDLNRVDSETTGAVVQPSPPAPVVDRPATDPIAPAPVASATNDPPRTVEAQSVTPEPKPEPLATRQRAPAGRPERIPQSTLTGLYVQSRPSGANVYLDDKLISTTPFQLSDIVPGRYTIRIDREGYRSWSAPVNIQRGARTNISAVLAP